MPAGAWSRKGLQDTCGSAGKRAVGLPAEVMAAVSHATSRVYGQGGGLWGATSDGRGLRWE